MPTELLIYKTNLPSKDTMQTA